MSSHGATAALDHHHDPSTSTGIPNKKLFMWAFLASDCMFFGALISTHLIYRLHPSEGSPDPRKLFSVELTSFSTFILLMSSLLMALGVGAIQRGHLRSTRRYLLGTIFFGLIFLACQVYEFNHFVHAGLTLSNSLFGSTFYTLTGTHGCHVAIGVLWLALMYIRSFKPAGDGAPSTAWFVRSLVHLVVMVVTTVAVMNATLGVIHVFEKSGVNAGALVEHFGHFWEALSLGVSFLGLVLLTWLHRSPAAVDFGERNAIDVEGAGLYWHFVDIVWIVIFTVVYLLEYLFLPGKF